MEEYVVTELAVLIREHCDQSAIDRWVLSVGPMLDIDAQEFPSPIDRRHYTYVLVRGRRPFYVGIGSGPRWRAHWELKSQDNNQHKKRIIMQLLAANIPKDDCVLFARTHLTRRQACILEVALIAAIGREPNGPLTNLSDGGEAGAAGYKWTVEQLSRFDCGKWITDGRNTTRLFTGEDMPEGWREGRLFSQDHIEAIRVATVLSLTPAVLANRHAAQTKYLASKPPEVWVTDGILNRRLGATAPVPDGWSVAHTLSSGGRAVNAAAATRLLAGGEASRRGNLAWQNEESRSKLIAARQDGCWITNGTETKRHYKSEPVPDGWRRGRGGLFGRAAAKAKQKEPEDEHGRLL